MAQGHPQAYFDSDQVLASSEALDPSRLLAAVPAREGLLVREVEGVGLVAARRIDDFTHAVADLAGVHAIDVVWRENPGELEPLETRAPDFGFLADAPPGVATRLLDAALAGPVVFTGPDPEAWIAWITHALPGGERITFSTAGDEDVRIRVAEGGIDTTEPCELPPSFYARVALELARRGVLLDAVARLEDADGLALAVHGGATDLIAPHQLPLALQLITELAAAGHVHEAARAAAALPLHTALPGTALVLREEPPLPEVIAPEPEEILEAEVVEEADEAPDATEPEPEVEEAEPVDDEFVIRDDEIISVPFEPAVDEEPIAPGQPIPDDVVIEVPFDVEPAEEAAEEPLPDVDAWSNLLSELKTESVTPDESLPELAEPEPEEEVIEEVELGISLAELEESLKQEGRE
ncbi:hypothetical protein DVA67_013905 [Solirubrobacter sp. CPCC 204708]|uniref:Uncharacterized protein n=1 Tax=Solirubrobacter deserti TaxID=2282478 RepID=A0ABT4RBX2_9ACTN|nr:hypothetical protein [Solirubrobacter deserti]MBE2317071.1 hypothetical protein [Solirubrobacter deserti]MDA0136037.1 hypothetical protein [Solirubrobacter deserti]